MHMQLTSGIRPTGAIVQATATLRYIPIFQAQTGNLNWQPYLFSFQYCLLIKTKTKGRP